MFENTLKRYQKAQEIDITPKNQFDRPQGTRVSGGMQKFFINLGTMDGANAGELLKFVSNAAGVAGRNIGKIDAKEKFSFLEVSSEFTDAVLAMKGEMWNNRRVSIELASPAPIGNGGGGRGGFGGNRGGGGYRGKPSYGGGGSRSRY